MQLLEEEETGQGSFRSVVAISGFGAYSILAGETGLHIFGDVGSSWSQATPWPCMGGSSYHQNCYIDRDQDRLTDVLEESVGLNATNPDGS